MKRKLLLIMLVLLLALVSGGLFAQEGPNNWISGQVGLLNFGVGYERVLTPQISVGGEAYWNNFFFVFTTSVVEAYGKYYFTKSIHAKLGLGYGVFTSPDKETSGFAIDPGVGWKIDLGKPGRFFIEPKVSVPIVLGKETVSVYEYDGITSTSGKKVDHDNGFKVKTNFVIAFAMGYAF